MCNFQNKASFWEIHCWNLRFYLSQDSPKTKLLLFSYYEIDANFKDHYANMNLIKINNEYLVFS